MVYKRKLSNSDDTPARVRYRKALTRIIPSVEWERDSRSDLRRRLEGTISNLQKRFSVAEIEAFVGAYNNWNCGILEDLDSEERFLSKASKLNPMQSLGLMLLLMEKMFPLPPPEAVKGDDIPF